MGGSVGTCIDLLAPSVCVLIDVLSLFSLVIHVTEVDEADFFTYFLNVCIRYYFD